MFLLLRDLISQIRWHYGISPAEKYIIQFISKHYQYVHAEIVYVGIYLEIAIFGSEEAWIHKYKHSSIFTIFLF